MPSMPRCSRPSPVSYTHLDVYKRQHLQTAQPVTFGHHLLAWFEMLSRDYERLVACRKRTNRMPLGSAALRCV